MTLRLTLVCAATCLTLGCAAEAEDNPQAQSTDAPALELTGRVVDAASIISAGVEADLTAKLEALESDTGVQLVVATTPSLDGREIDAYSLDLANAWGIGSAERDDGLLLLVAPNERQVRIDVGYGLEASVKDEEAAAIIYEAIVPEFRTGDFEAGIAKGVDRLVLEVTSIELKEAA